MNKKRIHDRPVERAIKEAYEDLANAIIIQAVEDYREVQIMIRKHPLNPEYDLERKRLLAFFRSDWFQILTKLDANMIIEKLEGKGEK